MMIENIGDLRVLLQTARAGSLTGAARALGVTPAAASAALKRMETQLGVRLFERSTRTMRLTPQGQILLNYASRAFDLIAEGEAQATSDRAGLVGLIRVAAPSDLTRSTLLPMLDEFLEAHPGVQLALSVGDRPLDVGRDEVDLAIRYGHLVDSRLVARPLMDTAPVVVAAPAYLVRHPAPKTPMDLIRHNCLAYDRAGRPHRTWRFTRDGQSIEVHVSGNRSVDDAGILLKTPVEMRHEMRDGRLVRLLADWQLDHYPLNVILPSGRFIPVRVRTLVNFLANRFRRISKELNDLLA
jgi:DNA-binding transcriptional LysR family regulator